MEPIVWRCVCSDTETAEFTDPTSLGVHRAQAHPERIRAKAAWEAVMSDTGDEEMAEAAYWLALTDSIAFVAEPVA